MKKIVVVITALILVACSEDSKNAASVNRPAPRVDVYEVKPTNVDRIVEVPGSIIPAEEIVLFSEVNGKVTQILFKEGQMVKKGEVLLRVDAEILTAQRKQLHVDLTLAESDERRKRGLLEGKAISAEEYEKSASALASIQAQLELIDAQIGKTVLRAPFSGVVGLRQVSEGAYVNSSTPIAKLVQLDPLKIEFSIAELYAPLIQVGQELSFTRERDSIRYSAKVYAFEPSIDQGTRMLKVRAQMKNEKQLYPGAFVQVKLDLGTENNAIMVPAEAIIPVLKGQQVYVARNKKVEVVSVDLGIRTSDFVQVLGDLQNGDKVLITGLLAVRPGMPVEIKSVR